ncbi:MAG: ribonuclease R [Alphaproteobacteria bacterium]
MDELMAYLNEQTRAVNKHTIARDFGLKGDDKSHLKDMLKNLKQSGVLYRNRGQMYVKSAMAERMTVEITGQDSMGDLVARPLEWPAHLPMPQIIIVKDHLSPPAGVGDLVQAKIKSVGNLLYEGEAVRRIGIGDNHIVGVFEHGFIQSVDKRLKQSFRLVNLPAEGLKNRDIVIADIPMIHTRDPEAMFVRKIGSEYDPFAATLISIYAHNLPVAFSEAGEKAADKATVPRVSRHREDLTAVPFVTIDGADARDFDDAVWAEPDTDAKNAGGWHIMVAIADVAWYVRTGSALDMDARERGNSVYFPDRVLPMLPEALSAGVCSLQPNQQRAAMVCEVWIDKVGHKIRHTFRRGLIRSVRRLTYEEVQAAMDGQTPIGGLEREIQALNGAYRSLLTRRNRRGVLEINVPEREVMLDDKGHVTDIKYRTISDSNKLIEEMMILANVAAAETLEDKGAPTMYRVHDRPSVEKIEALNTFLKTTGQKSILSRSSEPKDFNAVLKNARADIQTSINEFVLRSQSQAVYSPENIGHFGLALQRYAHFTSPIRRYADILVHRALIGALKLGEGALSEDETTAFEKTAQHISYMERQAAAAETEAEDRYIAGWLADKIGAQFNGRISGVTAFGLFVELDIYGADGFVPLRTLNGHYTYDSQTMRLYGKKNRSYGIGDYVQVVLKEAVPAAGSLLFMLANEMSETHKRTPHQKKADTRRAKRSHKRNR